MRNLFLLALTGSVMLSCSSWVQLTSAGTEVQLATPAEVTSCTRLGTSNANVLDRVAFIQRGTQRLQDELVTLARNDAGDMGGNRVVAESTITEGAQTFGVYRCD
ncbi:MAG: DUF4156 domain-containing protein [Pseudomonadales bacterium]|nr:DUF4156 domain-containing protein [Pseudomonadales bacterium]